MELFFDSIYVTNFDTGFHSFNMLSNVMESFCNGRAPQPNGQKIIGLWFRNNLRVRDNRIFEELRKLREDDSLRKVDHHCPKLFSDYRKMFDAIHDC